MKIGFKLCFESGILDGEYYEQLFEQFVKFTPNRFVINHSVRNWNEKKHLKIIKDCKKNDYLIVSNNENIFITTDTSSDHPHRSTTIIQNIDIFNPANDEVKEFIDRDGFVAAYLYDEGYVNVQSTEYENNLKEREDLLLSSVKDTPYYFDESGFKVYDISHNPGREQLIGYTWLLSCWKMWFGEGFYHLVSKERLLAFPDAYKKEELPNGQVYIQLFENIEDSMSEEARKKQWDWRSWLKFDDLVKNYP